MSRTYRKHLDWYVKYEGDIYHWKEWWKIKTPIGRSYCGHYKINKKGRDQKPWDKPPKFFKQINRQIERARVRSAMDKEDYENIPLFKTGDQYDWT